MDINRMRVDRWKQDVQLSVEMYNSWFFDSAPVAYRDSRIRVHSEVDALFKHTNNLRSVTPAEIIANPSLVGILRQVAAPPLARDRLAGLAGVSRTVVDRLEKGRIPQNLKAHELHAQIQSMINVVSRMADRELFCWLDDQRAPSQQELAVARVVVADRRTGALSDPIIRNAQEARQITVLEKWLQKRGYTRLQLTAGTAPNKMQPGTYAIHQNIPVINAAGKRVNMPLDLVVQPLSVNAPSMPVLIEAKSAGDFTNTNKRRKEEATKLAQLRSTYGKDTNLLLFLCGYFDTGYLGYEAAEGIDWVWEHRVEDLSLAGL
ncbi:MAG: XamI family restriction endonuclease [Arcanobacterium sp.]